MFFLKQMRPPQQMQGRLKSFSVETTQGIWSIDVSSITGAGKPPADATQQPQPSARPQPQVPRDANMVKTKNMPPTRSVHQSHAGPSTGRDLHESDDDDDAFMEPPPWRRVLKKQCTNANVAANATAKVQHSNLVPHLGASRIIVITCF